MLLLGAHDVAHRRMPFELIELFHIKESALRDANTLDAASRERSQVGKIRNYGFHVDVEIESVEAIHQLGRLGMDLLADPEDYEAVFDAWVVYTMVDCVHASRVQTVCADVVARLPVTVWVAVLVAGRIDCADDEEKIVQISANGAICSWSCRSRSNHA